MPIWENPNILSGQSPQVMNGAIKPEVGLCIIHQGLVTTEWAMRLRILQMPPYIYMLNRNQPYDTAREQTARGVLEKKVKWLFFLDTDTLIPVDCIPKMIEWSEQFNLPILSGVYWAKKPGPPMVCAWRKTGEHPEQNRYDFMSVDIKPHMDTEAIIPVDVCGAGCLLIKADVFKKLDESNPKLPYFQWGLGRNYNCPKCGATGPLPMMSEDFFFCMRCVQELNIHPHIVTNVKCDHICTAIKRGEDGEFELSRM